MDFKWSETEPKTKPFVAHRILKLYLKSHTILLQTSRSFERGFVAALESQQPSYEHLDVQSPEEMPANLLTTFRKGKTSNLRVTRMYASGNRWLCSAV
jgi:hypothetical protein